MPKVVGVKFNSGSKQYFFDPGEYTFTKGCGVIVETSRGLEYATVAALPRDVDEGSVVPPLKPITRLATPEDEAKVEKNRERREAALPVVLEKIEKSKLNMKFVDMEYTFEANKLIVYFTADGRVDFRNLVRDLASTFHIGIELRQIGARDECRMKGGVAPCGRACCCSDHVSDFAHVSIKMAKNQNLSLNPTKISGLCGRLMCCLAYENAHYAETNKRMPKVGSTVETTDGKKGVVFSNNQLKETVRLKVENKDSFDFTDYALKDILFKGKTTEDEAEADVKVDDELKSLID